MKKIIVAIAVLAISTVTANARNVSLTAGVGFNSSVFGATGKETNLTETNTAGHIKNEKGVFTDSYTTGFIELNLGDYVSLGYEHTPDAISTPQNETRENVASSTVSVDFNDVNTMYLKINFGDTGLFARAGYVETDLDIKESMASGRTYSNVSTEGTVLGLGYSKQINDSALGIRVEGSYMELDDVSTNNGVSSTGGSVANGGRNTVEMNSAEGLTGKIALTLTLGRD